MSLRHEHRRWATAGLDADLRFTVGDVVAHRLIRDARHRVLIDQTGIDPFNGVLLLAGRVKVGPQHRIGLNGSSLEPRRGYCFRGAGQADVRAALTVRRPTPCLRSISRPDSPARESRRIAA